MRWAFVMRLSALSRVASNCRISRRMNVKGMPKRDSVPKVLSGNVTPISLMAILVELMPALCAEAVVSNKITHSHSRTHLCDKS